MSAPVTSSGSSERTSAPAGVSSAMTPLPPPLPLDAALDAEELTESVLKWVWLAWMIFAVSMFLPAMRLATQGGVMEPKGYNMAQVAHGVVYDFLFYGAFPSRRIRPFSPLGALGIGMMGTLANWLVVTCGCTALLAVRRVRAKTIIRWAAVGAIVAGVSAMASCILVVNARDAISLPGVYAWCVAPWVLALGLVRRGWGEWRVGVRG